MLVADAGLGTINAVRLTTEALGALGAPQVVVLNRFDASIDLHERNRSWLRSLDLGPVVTIPEDGTRWHRSWRVEQEGAPKRGAPGRTS